jgi:hypothetical protein
MVLTRKILVVLLLIGMPTVIPAADWASVTMDNDVLVKSDNGYTSGFYGSWYELGRGSFRKSEPSLLVSPLLWSLSDNRPLYTINASAIGQMIVTPEDTKSETPNPDDIPYAGLLFYADNHIQVFEDHADRIGTVLGIVGPASGAESTQKYVHNKLDGNEPQGWENQLDNELVFQFSRERVWRLWGSDRGDGDFDLLGAGDLNLGTLESSLGSNMMVRYGSGLANSFATTMFRGSRVANSLAITGGWYVYFGVSARYYGNLIFADGNTFKESQSVEMDASQAGLFTGFTYSWRNISLTLAFEDPMYFRPEYENIMRYGSIIVAWRL